MEGTTYPWALETLQAHRNDERTTTYTRLDCQLQKGSMADACMCGGGVKAWAVRRGSCGGLFLCWAVHARAPCAAAASALLASPPSTLPAQCHAFPRRASRVHVCRQQLEDGKTHDELWNAGQLEMVHRWGWPLAMGEEGCNPRVRLSWSSQATDTTYPN